VRRDQQAGHRGGRARAARPACPRARRGGSLCAPRGPHHPLRAARRRRFDKPGRFPLIVDISGGGRSAELWMKRMLFVFAVLAYGCGDDNPGTPSNTLDAMDVDAQNPDAAPGGDHGAPSNTYPAFTPDKPTIINNGGLVLTQPKIVTISLYTNP